MAANLEQIFQDFIINKIKEIEDQDKDKDAVVEGDGAQLQASPPEKEKIEENKEEDSQKTHKKHKKHKSNKKKKKKKRKKEGKEGRDSSSQESEGEGKNKDSKGAPTGGTKKESGNDDDGKPRSKRHGSGRKKKKKKKRKRKEGEASSAHSDSEIESKPKPHKNDSSKKREELPDIVPKQETKGVEDNKNGSSRRKHEVRSHSPSGARTRSRTHSRSPTSAARKRSSRSRSKQRHRQSRRTRSRSRSSCRRRNRSRSSCRRRNRSRSPSRQKSKTTSTSDKLNKNNIPVPTNGTPVPVKGTPVPVKGTPVPVKGTPVPAKGTPVPVKGTPIPTNGTPVSTSGTPVPTNETSGPTSGAPVPTSETSGPTSGAPLPTSGAPLPTSETSVPTSETSVPTNETSVPTNETSVPTNVTPVPTNVTPVLTNAPPVPTDEQLPPVPDLPTAVTSAPSAPVGFVGGWKPVPFLEEVVPPSSTSVPSPTKVKITPDESSEQPADPCCPAQTAAEAEGPVSEEAPAPVKEPGPEVEETQLSLPLQQNTTAPVEDNSCTVEGHPQESMETAGKTEVAGSAVTPVAPSIPSTSVSPIQAPEMSNHSTHHVTSAGPRPSKTKSPTKRRRVVSTSPEKKREAKASKRKRKSRSKSPRRSHKKRSATKSPSRKKRSRSRSRGRRSRRSRSRSRSRSVSRSRWRYSQRDRWKREPSHSPVLILRKNRSPPRKPRSPSKSPHRLSDLNKGQLLEIAKANAAAMCAKAGMPIPASLRSTMLPMALPAMAMNAAMASMTAATVTAALSSMGALTTLPPLPSITNKPPPGPPAPNLAALEEVKRKVTKQANSISIKEFTEKCRMIVDSEGELPVAKPHVSDEEEEDGKRFGAAAAREQKAISFSLNNIALRPGARSDAGMAKEFPVSSGSQHRKKEGEPSGAYGEWVPVDKSAGASSNASADPAATDSTSEPAAAAAQPIDSVFPEPPPQPVDISQAVTERIKAQRRLAENPYDVNAICMLSRAQEQVDAWAQSNTIPGLFTGSTGAQVLSSEELSTSGPQAWLKKDQFLRAAPVSGGVGEFLMRKMGWRTGEGLGRNREGTVEPIIIDFKVDRKGLVAEGEKAQKQTGGLVITKDMMGKHPVSALIELCNKQRIMQPDFVMVHHSGPDHRKNFLFKVTVNGVDYQPQTVSPNKKHAKAMAATVALQALGEVPVEGPGLYTGPVFTAASTGPLFST